MSVSTVRTFESPTWWHRHHALESASSWLQGAKLVMSRAGTQSAVSPLLVTTRDFPSVALATSSLLRSLNNSPFFSFMQRNCFQFLGMGLDNSTHLRWVGPVLCFSLVCAVKVLVLHNVYSLSLIFFPFDVGSRYICSESPNVTRNQFDMYSFVSQSWCAFWQKNDMLLKWSIVKSTSEPNPQRKAYHLKDTSLLCDFKSSLYVILWYAFMKRLTV